MIRNMLHFDYGLEPSNLDNCTDSAQVSLPEKGDSTMAKHRMRICIGYNDDGSAVEKMVSGNSQHELADKVVRAILNSERRSEFLEELGVANEE